MPEFMKFSKAYLNKFLDKFYQKIQQNINVNVYPTTWSTPIDVLKQKPALMAKQQFHGCCGVNVIHGFGMSINNDYVGPPNKEFMLETLNPDKQTVAIDLVALNLDQRLFFHNILIQHGFEILMENMPHPNQKSYITLYGRKMSEKVLKVRTPTGFVFPDPNEALAKSEDDVVEIVTI